MARGFGATLGSGSTDRVTSALTAHSTLRSYAAWVWMAGAGGGSFGRVLDKNAGTESERITYNTGPKLGLLRAWSTSGNWEIAWPALSEWHHFGVSYDSSSTANDAVIYLDGVLETLVTSTNPTGTIVTTSNPYTIGNRNAGDRNWDGALAQVAIWDAILTADEWLGLGKGASPLLIRPMSLVEYVPFVGSTTHSWVAGATTVTGTAVRPDAFPLYYPGRRRRIYIPAAGTNLVIAAGAQAQTPDNVSLSIPGAARPALIGGKLTNSNLLGGLVR